MKGNQKNPIALTCDAAKVFSDLITLLGKNGIGDRWREIVSWKKVTITLIGVKGGKM